MNKDEIKYYYTRYSNIISHGSHHVSISYGLNYSTGTITCKVTPMCNESDITEEISKKFSVVIPDFNINDSDAIYDYAKHISDTFNFTMVDALSSELCHTYAGVKLMKMEDHDFYQNTHDRLFDLKLNLQNLVSSKRKKVREKIQKLSEVHNTRAGAMVDVSSISRVLNGDISIRLSRGGMNLILSTYGNYTHELKLKVKDLLNTNDFELAIDAHSNLIHIKSDIGNNMQTFIADMKEHTLDINKIDDILVQMFDKRASMKAILNIHRDQLCDGTQSKLMNVLTSIYLQKLEERLDVLNKLAVKLGIEE